MKRLSFNLATCFLLCIGNSRIYASAGLVPEKPVPDPSETVAELNHEDSGKSNTSQVSSGNPDHSVSRPQEVYHNLQLEEFDGLTLEDLKLSCVQRFERIIDIMEKDKKVKKRKTRLAAKLSGSTLLIPYFGMGLFLMGDVVNEYKLKKKVRKSVMKSIREISDTFYTSQLIKDGHSSQLSESEISLFKRLYQQFIKKKVTQKITDSEVAQIYYDGMESGYLCRHISLSADYGRSGNYRSLYVGEEMNYVEHQILKYYSKALHDKKSLVQDIHEYKTRRDNALKLAKDYQNENAVLNS